MTHGCLEHKHELIEPWLAAARCGEAEHQALLIFEHPEGDAAIEELLD